jgi:hypothetical protein
VPLRRYLLQHPLKARRAAPAAPDVARFRPKHGVLEVEHVIPKLPEHTNLDVMPGCNISSMTLASSSVSPSTSFAIGYLSKGAPAHEAAHIVLCSRVRVMGATGGVMSSPSRMSALRGCRRRRAVPRAGVGAANAAHHEAR